MKKFFFISPYWQLALMILILASLRVCDVVYFTVCDRHDGPVWQLAWAHPMYGSILATCGYDRKVIMWKECDDGWQKIYEYTNHESSGNYFNFRMLTELFVLIFIWSGWEAVRKI